MEVVFSQRAIAAVMAETAEKIQTETGGLFLGKVIGDTWYVVESIDPGPNSVFEVAYFEYDQPYVQHLINKVAAIYQERLDLIGLWHRHPGSFDQFSGTDDQTNHVYASMRPQGAISILVNLDPDFRMTVYHVGQTYRNYRRISYEIGNERFPQQLLEYRSVEDSLALMRRKCGRSEAGETSDKKSIENFMEEVSSYLDMQITAPAMGVKQVVSEEQMTRMLDLLYADLEFLQEKNISVRVRWNENTLWLLPESNNENESVRFTDLTENKMLGAWREKVFYYHSGDLEKAWNDAHDTSDGKSPKENGRMEKIARRFVMFGMRKGN